MSAPIVGYSQALFGLSPWIIPLIAGAMKRGYGKVRARARGVLRIGRTARRADGPPQRTSRRRASGPVIVMHERLRARVEATIWPD